MPLPDSPATWAALAAATWVLAPMLVTTWLAAATRGHVPDEADPR